MKKIIIEKDDGKSNSYDLKDFQVIPQSDYLLLKLDLGNTTVGYKITTDARGRDINEIKTFITNQLESVTTTEIREYLQRCYIFIGNNIHDTRQFSANKI